VQGPLERSLDRSVAKVYCGTMTKKGVEAKFGDAPGIGEEYRDGPVNVTMASDGRAVLLPSSFEPAYGDVDLLADVQASVRAIRRQRDQLDAAVMHARVAGLSWATIGFSVGTTGEAARQRWGKPAGKSG
jgi:hypothetical protein